MDVRARLLELTRAQPFRAFVVSMSNGRDLVVPGSEWLIVGARISTFGYIDEEGYDRTVFIYHENINTTELYSPVQSPTTALE